MNIFEILANAGVNVDENKKQDIEKAISEHYTANSEVEKIKTASDKYKEQLETSQEALKGFEGVNVDELKAKITQLNNDIQTKDKEYQNKIADMEFNSILDNAITKSGAKNSKAIKALLDLEALKTSKNQADDISKAIEQVKTDNDYMFKSAEPFKNAVHSTGNTGFSSNSADDFMRSVMGLPPADSNKNK